VYRLSEPITQIGRALDNDIVLTGADALVVSGRHAEVRSEEGGWRIYDLQSTNGTFVNGERVIVAALQAPCTIQLGKGGPELTFSTSEPPSTASDLAQTIVANTTRDSAPVGAPLAAEHERLLRRAIVRTRLAHREGRLNQTGMIIREAIARAVRHSGRRFKAIIAAFAVVLAGVIVYSGFRINQLRQAKASIDSRIAVLEHKLADSELNPKQEDQLASEMARYQNQALALQQDVLYRVGVHEREDFLTHEIRTLLAEFGAEVYSVPAEFRDSVQRYLNQYQGPNRPNVARALNEARPVMDRIRQVLAENHLPPDFAYIVLVESALYGNQESRAGSAGLWQFTPATARALGLRVDSRIDDRLNVVRASRAACKYIRDLILDFGAGSSVMLALAAYNVGPAKVKQAVRRVTDPIKQRNFWYLYHVRALPEETREYVPKVIAAMIIGRHPERYGF
jgi:soluble lytic murein transglycosylase-like protein